MGYRRGDLLITADPWPGNEFRKLSKGIDSRPDGYLAVTVLSSISAMRSVQSSTS
jgi:hypothetical protein